MTDVNAGKLNAMHFYAWKSGLKTGMYYLRTKAAADAIKFTLREDRGRSALAQAQEQLVCSLENPDECVSCGS